MDAPLVSFVVPTFRRPTALSSTLCALLELDYPRDRFEVIVVDDGSGDDTPKVVDKISERRDAVGLVRYLHQPNRGAAAARNNGAHVASGTFLIFVDDDIVVEPDHVTRHLDSLALSDTTIVNGQWTFAPDVLAELRSTAFGRFRLDVEEWVKGGLPKRRRPDGLFEPDVVTACNMSIRREYFWTLGGFDESFPFAGCEDQDFSHRAKDAGALLLYDERIRLLHNDQRVTRHQFCDRQRQGATTAVYLASKRPEQAGRAPLITENTPILRDDSLRVALKKIAKRALSTRVGLAAFEVEIRLAERYAPSTRLMYRSYWVMCGVHIFLGVRDGLARINAEH